ncbi:Med5-domain-containing protein [Pseudovirgaria hyperparasitica]|uniref:Mediator of RNA polymerase II transcription subunit 5 n=1 Tax=Pseudovirgaria hyperparasitica TaxID=470096 RepID=A0A6A6WAH3_9PEZI|nr:Med5-domain-containing protein [Pseudovirgaria hyperparasitica]KAF2759673.1 Med5-domain-containing protein [Pseudovirgaria hyperparasitica]
MDSPVKEEPPSEVWARFVNNCLAMRVRPERFDALSQKLIVNSPIEGRFLANIVLRPQTPGYELMDPLVLGYLEKALSRDLIDAGDILLSLFRWSKDRPYNNDEDKNSAEAHRRNPPRLDELVLHHLARVFADSQRPKSPPEARRTLILVTKWMVAMVDLHHKDSMLQAMNGAEHTHRIVARDALGQLAIALLSNARVVGIMNNRIFRKGEKKSLAQAVSTFVPFLAQISINTSSRLAELQKSHDLVEEPLNDIVGDKEANDLAVATMQLQSVAELPVINSRSGLFIFLNSLLVGRPLTDDTTILVYLSNRYKGDAQRSTVDLITAAFDVLSNGNNRHESQIHMFNLRSFLVNKVPTIIATLSHSMFPPLTPEFCITQALAHIDPNSFPSLAHASFDVAAGDNPLMDVRQDFLFACALHRLLPVESIERLLGEQPMSDLPSGGAYTKGALVSQCSANPERVEELLNEIERMDGNVGAIAIAITEVVRNLCASKETMSLKAVCNGLSRRPKALDIILQYTSPTSILQPLCHMLDAWRHEEDQGEYQPVFDEFGAILLLVLAFVHRFDLTAQELGLNNDSFVAQLLQRGHISIKQRDLTPEQGKHLAGWVNDLFGKDGVDQVLRTCGPQEFYQLVPTFFSQTMMACAADVLPLKTVESGLEYLLETFLLPSLVGALRWMAARALQKPGKEIVVLIQVFNKLMRPSSISGDAQAMHNTILSIVSKQLQACFQVLRKHKQLAKEIEPLIERLKPHLKYERTAYSSVSEIETWTSHSSTLCQVIRGNIQQLISWATNATRVLVSPPPYPARLLHVAERILGPSKVLRAIIDEVRAQTDTGHGEYALDIGVSMICAVSTDNSPLSVDWLTSPVPSPHVPRTRPNLRDMLKVELDEAADLIASDPLTAETIVRLHRRVEAQLAVSALPDLSTTVIIQDMHIDVDVPSDSNNAQQNGMDSINLGGSTDDMMSGLGDLGGDTGDATNHGGDLDLGDLGDMDNLGDIGDMGNMDMDEMFPDYF